MDLVLIDDVELHVEHGELRGEMNQRKRAKQEKQRAEFHEMLIVGGDLDGVS